MFGICSFGVQWKTVSSIVHKNFKTSRHTYIYIEEKPSDFERWGKREALSCPRGEGGVGGAGGNLLHITLWVDLRKQLWVALNRSNQNFLNSFTTHWTHEYVRSDKNF